MAKINYELTQNIHENLVENIRDNYIRYYYLAYSFVKNEEVALKIVTNAVYFSLYNGRKLKSLPAMNVWFLQLVIKDGMRTMHRNNFPRAFTATSQLYAYMETIEPSATNVFKLFYFEELGVEKIAEVLHFKDSEVKQRLDFVRRELKIESTLDKESKDRLAELTSIYESCTPPDTMKEEVEDAIKREEDNFSSFFKKYKMGRIWKPIGVVIFAAALFFLTIAAGKTNQNFADSVMAVPLINHIFAPFFNPL